MPQFGQEHRPFFKLVGLAVALIDQGRLFEPHPRGVVKTKPRRAN